MRLSFSLVLLACILACAYADSPSCSAKITVAKRMDQYASWTDEEGMNHQIWDVKVTNDGTCPLTRIAAFFSGLSSDLSEQWNYDMESGLVYGYGAALPVGWTFSSAGFVLTNFSTPALLNTRPACDDSCLNAPSTAMPSTNAPSTAMPSTSAPSDAAGTTTTTTTTTTSSPQGCAVTATVQRDGDSWIQDGKNTSVYRLTITNAGPCALKDYALSFGYYPGTLFSFWNLEGTRGGYFVRGYGDTLAAGASYSGAGMILQDAPEHVDAYPYGSNCAC